MRICITQDFAVVSRTASELLVNSAATKLVKIALRKMVNN
jgi:hypothetical protein